MQFKYENKINKNFLHYFYEKGTFELPKILSESGEHKLFNTKKRDLAWTFTTIRYKSSSDYIHLFEEAQFDAN